MNKKEFEIVCVRIDNIEAKLDVLLNKLVHYEEEVVRKLQR